MYVVDPSSYAHVTQLGRGGKREGGSSTWVPSLIGRGGACIVHGVERRRRREEGRRGAERRRLTCSICLLNTTRPRTTQRASERERPCLLTSRASAMDHGAEREDRQPDLLGEKRKDSPLKHFSRGLQNCHYSCSRSGPSCIPNYCKPADDRDRLFGRGRRRREERE